MTDLCCDSWESDPELERGHTGFQRDYIDFSMPGESARDRRGWWRQPRCFGLLCAFRVTGGDHCLVGKRSSGLSLHVGLEFQNPEAHSPFEFSSSVLASASSKMAGQGTESICWIQLLCWWKRAHLEAYLRCFPPNFYSQKASLTNHNYKEIVTTPSHGGSLNK